jgi:hypothetical protein
MDETTPVILTVNWRSLAYCGKHRADPHPDWVSAHPDRLGAHANVEEPFRREGAMPVAELITGEPS